MIDPFFKYFSKYREDPSTYFTYSTDLSGKEYPWAKVTTLAHAQLPDSEKKLSTILEERVSSKCFQSYSLPFSHLSLLLQYSFGFTKNGNRACPSGGNLRPIECYFVAKNCDQLTQDSVHYFNPYQKALACFRDPVTVLEIEDCYPKHKVGHPLIPTASIVIILSFVRSRVLPKYGSFGYKAGLLEAGHIGQNIYLVASMLGLSCRAIGSSRTKSLNKMLHLDGLNENAVYTLVVGKECDEKR